MYYRRCSLFENCFLVSLKKKTLSFISSISWNATCQTSELLLYQVYSIGCGLHRDCATQDNPTPPYSAVQSAIVLVVQSLILRVVGQWAKFVGCYDVWYNKGLHKTGEKSIVRKGCTTNASKKYYGVPVCRLCKIGGGTDIISSYRLGICVWSSVSILTHHFSVASLMPV